METKKQFIESEIFVDAMIEQLSQSRQVSFTVTGMSMWPVMCHGRDSVIIESCQKDDIKVGDIVFYRKQDKKAILHRVTKCNKETFQTTGDGLFSRDQEMPYDRLIGKVIDIIRPERVIHCSDLKWKCLFRIWMLLFPFRRLMFYIWFKIRKRKSHSL